MPPITAAIRTPNAPTPPRSSAAGGLENVVEPVACEELVVELLRLEPVDVPLAGLEGFAAVEPVEGLEAELEPEDGALADVVPPLGEL